LIIILGMVLYIGLYPSEGAVESFIAKALNDSLHLYGAESPNASTGLDEKVNMKENTTGAWDKVQTRVRKIFPRCESVPGFRLFESLL